MQMEFSDIFNGVIECNSNSIWTAYQFPVEMLLLLMVTNLLQYRGITKTDRKSGSLDSHLIQGEKR